MILCAINSAHTSKQGLAQLLASRLIALCTRPHAPVVAARSLISTHRRPILSPPSDRLLAACHLLAALLFLPAYSDDHFSAVLCPLNSAPSSGVSPATPLPYPCQAQSHVQFRLLGPRAGFSAALLARCPCFTAGQLTSLCDYLCTYERCLPGYRRFGVI